MSEMGRKLTLAWRLNERPLTTARQRPANDCNGNKAYIIRRCPNKPIDRVAELARESRMNALPFCWGKQRSLNVTLRWLTSTANKGWVALPLYLEAELTSLIKPTP